MVALLNEITWWHWIVFGVLLIVIEMSTGTFFMLTLGISALLVGTLDVLFELSFKTEILLWLLFSIVSVIAWMKWFKDRTVSNSGQSNYRLDTLGTVKAEIRPHHRGKVLFDTPVLGNTEWHATAKTDIASGTRVKIVEINGQLIEVAPVELKIEN
ncbi:MAG: NfeD family protein [Sulfurovum sp.]|nr:NfeD family protein [Sulfurovum sp.]